MDTEDDIERLAAYRAGRLAPAEAEAFRAQLERDPGAAAWDKLAEGIAATEAEGEAAPGEFGWARLNRSLDAEMQPAAETAPASAPAAANTGWRVPIWQVAAALVVGIGLWQAAVVPQLTPGAPDAGFTTAGVEGVGVTVLFRPDAEAAEITEMLRTVGATIVDGPSALGLYTVAPREGPSDAELAEALAERTGLVESATLP
ncbi:MAG: hypothetical protein AAFR47_06085 [Pseudomonadota bacterium]